jgi:hypothetical protein
VPAAFSGTCSNQVPGFVEKLSEFKAKGVNDIYVVAVNDFFVLSYVFTMLVSEHPYSHDHGMLGHGRRSLRAREFTSSLTTKASLPPLLVSSSTPALSSDRLAQRFVHSPSVHVLDH